MEADEDNDLCDDDYCCHAGVNDEREQAVAAGR